MAQTLQTARSGGSGPRVLLLEPYLTASHRAFAQGLMEHLPGQWTMLGLPGRHFRWRMRGAPLYLALAAADVLSQPWDALVCSSMLGLAELRGLVPALARTPAVAVFHENQLAYPAPGAADGQMLRRDLYLAFSNLGTAVDARRVVFNSEFHRRQFLEAAAQTLAELPDMRPPGLVERLAANSLVLPVPIDPGQAAGLTRPERHGPLRLVWNHRWAQDKDPEALFAALGALAASGAEFQVAIMGTRPPRWPAIFDQAPELLGQRLVQLGPVDDRREYWRWLHWADVCLSTARQEYFGLSVAEATWAGCLPLVPDALVYPELYPAQCLYQPGRLTEALAALVADPAVARRGQWCGLAEAFTWQRQAPAWEAVILEAINDV